MSNKVSGFQTQTPTSLLVGGFLGHRQLFREAFDFTLLKHLLLLDLDIHVLCLFQLLVAVGDGGICGLESWTLEAECEAKGKHVS